MGVMPDAPEFELPPGALSSGNNIRIFDGALASSQGWMTERHSELSGSTYNFNFVHSWITDTPGFLYAGNEKIMLDKGADDLEDLTGSVGIASDAWRGAQVGTGFILCNGANIPLSMAQFELDGTTPQTEFDALPGWPSDYTAKYIIPFEGYLIAIGIQKSAFDRPFMVKWSDLFDPITLEADWDPTSSQNLAGENDLASTDGEIIDVVPLGDALFIFLSFGCYRMSLVGGSFVL